MKLMFLMAALCFSQTSMAEMSWKKVVQLDRMDATRGFEVIDNKLLMSRVGTSDTEHRVEVYSADGSKLLATVNLPHSVSYIYPTGAKEAVVVGKAFTSEWFTYYSTINWQSGSFRSKTTRFKNLYQVHEYGQVAGKNFFTEPGSRSVYSERSGRLRALPFEISFPSQIIEASDSMWLLEKRGPGPGDESLLHIDLKTMQLSKMEGVKGVYGPYTMRTLSSERLVLDDRLGSKLWVYDTRNRKVAYELPLKETPMSLTLNGSCAFIPSGDQKTLAVVKLGEKEANVINHIDFSAAEGEFHNAINVAVSPKSETIFVRSVNPCFTCQASSSAVYAVKAESLDWSQCR